MREAGKTIFGGSLLTLNVPLVLASRSPRRSALLRRLDVPFTVHPSSVEEVWPENEPPGAAVESIALQKAKPVSLAHPEALTLGADTVVVLEGEVLGKPGSEAEAHAMLDRLSGGTHTVYTGLALLHPSSGRSITDHEATQVTFAELDDGEITRYVATGSPMDKAGAYGIQDDYGAFFVSRIDGDFYNVVGLPLHCLYRMLTEHFADLLGTPPVHESTAA